MSEPVFHLECGATYSPGDEFPKGVPLEQDGEIYYSSGEKFVNHGTVVEVPVQDGPPIFCDHRPFWNMAEDLKCEIENLKEEFGYEDPEAEPEDEELEHIQQEELFDDE